MPRKHQAGHHRNDHRIGPWFAWLQRKAYHLAKLFAHVWASYRMRASMRLVGRGLYQIEPAAVVRWRDTLDDAMPYARDTEGEIWA